jgi:ketosteroid isomerase-like protein
MAADSQVATNKQIVKRALTAWSKGPEKFWAIADPDIVWIMHAPVAWYPFAGEHKGIDALKATHGMLGRLYEIVSYNVVDVSGEKNRVWALVDASYKARSDGRTINFAHALRLTLRRGKVVELVEFFDSAGALMQEGRIGKKGDGR